MTPEPTGQLLHASCVLIGTQAVLITGPSGSGKSALALDLMSRGAQLVSDDQTMVSNARGTLIATPAPAIRGRIEARGIGILCANAASRGIVRLVVDLEKEERERLPLARTTVILGVELDTIRGKGNVHLAAALHVLLMGGRVDLNAE